ncbi:MAG: hypothetical protein ACOX8H_11375 [Ruminococcus sp.]|jgi:hypothetical protein
MPDKYKPSRERPYEPIYTGIFEYTFNVAQKTRRLFVYIPREVLPSTAGICIFPPNGISAREFLEYSNWIDIAEGEEQRDKLVLCYHYCHYDGLHREVRYEFESPRMVYDIFLNMADMNINVMIQNCDVKKYHAKIYLLNREYGSAFDRWIDMGCPLYLSKEETKELIRTSVYRIQHSQIQTTERTLQFKISLHPYEVQLWEFCPAE